MPDTNTGARPVTCAVIAGKPFAVKGRHDGDAKKARRQRGPFISPLHRVLFAPLT